MPPCVCVCLCMGCACAYVCVCVSQKGPLSPTQAIYSFFVLIIFSYFMLVLMPIIALHVFIPLPVTHTHTRTHTDSRTHTHASLAMWVTLSVWWWQQLVSVHFVTIERSVAKDHKVDAHHTDKMCVRVSAYVCVRVSANSSSSQQCRPKIKKLIVQRCVWVLRLCVHMSRCEDKNMSVKDNKRQTGKRQSYCVWYSLSVFVPFWFSFSKTVP